MSGTWLWRSVLAVLTFTSCAAEAGENTPPLELTAAGVTWHGMPLIVREQVSWPGPDHMQGGQHTTQTDAKGWRVDNLYTETSKLPFRREIGISPDGREIELNFQARFGPYQFSEWTKVEYVIDIPLAALQGMRWTAQCGGTNNPEVRSGQISSRMMEGPLASGIRWISFEGGGRSLSFDFNPHGVTTYSDHLSNFIISLWRVWREGDYLRCAFGTNGGPIAEAPISKLVILEGGFEQFKKRHPFDQYTYFTEWPADWQIAFGDNRVGPKYRKAGRQAFSNDSGLGWTEPTAVRQVSRRDSGAVYSAARGDGTNAFICKLARPGLYMVTARFPAYSGPIGPFEVALNGQRVADLTVAPNTLKEVSFLQWMEEGKAELQLKGAWQIATLAIQPLLSTPEDYVIRRGFWRITDFFEPSEMFSSRHNLTPPEFTTSVEEIPLVAERSAPPGYQPNMKRESASPDPAGMEWRYSTSLAAMGPMNNGTFHEYEDRQALQRRFDELVADGYGTIICNGLLSRHTFPEDLPRVTRELAAYAAEAHRRNMKLIDHQDMTLLWQWGNAYRVLAESVPHLQREINSGMPTRGLCPWNPVFRQRYIDHLLEMIRSANLDGIMIDEVAFHGENFCGCIHCRRQFKSETGLDLPLDETSADMNNMDSLLWRTWLSWRKKRIGDWWVDFRRQVSAVKPDFSILQYTTEYGVSSRYGSIGFGHDLVETFRGVDFSGTEIQTRNPMACYRASNAFRKIKSAIGTEFDQPVFGLVYPRGADLAYYGWALNNMNRQVTWWLGPPPKLDGFGYNFPRNMSLQSARPMGDVAVLYSFQSRDWSPAGPYHAEPHGISERLSDHHMLHEMILDRTLENPQRLAQFHGIVIGNAACLSDAQIKGLREFVQQGGTAYLSGEAATCDEIGSVRPQWPLADIFGFSPAMPVKVETAERLLTANNLSADGPVHLNVLTLSPAVKAEPRLWAIVDGQKKPIAFVAQHGKGKMVYVGCLLGSLLQQTQYAIGAVWGYNPPADRFAILDYLQRETFSGNENWRAVSIPLTVLANAYRQPENGTDRVIVHLLNSGGNPMKPGEKVPAMAPQPAWPPMQQDIVFEVKLPALREAFALSPDFAEAKPVSFQPASNDWWRISVPAAVLTRYSMIHLVP